MNIDDMRHTFDERYYRWRLSECEREVREGFPLLSRVPHDFVIGFLEFTEGRTPTEQLALMQSLVIRYTHESVLGGRVLSAAEKALIERFHSAFVLEQISERRVQN